MNRSIILGVALILFPSLSWADSSLNNFQLTSPDFENNAPIPKDYTCDGNDRNPALVIKNVPPKTRSLALLVSEPDAPEGNWSHWVVYNIPPNTTEIIENTNPGTEGLSDFGKYVYGGPCPPDDKLHHYVFRAYALDDIVNINEGPSLSEVEKAFGWHVIARAELVGTYQKSTVF